MTFPYFLESSNCNFQWGDTSFPKSFQPHYGSGVNSASKEMSTRNLPGGKVRPTRKTDNLTVGCERIV
jgi:hypothetical protein